MPDASNHALIAWIALLNAFGFAKTFPLIAGKEKLSLRRHQYKVSKMRLLEKLLLGNRYVFQPERFCDQTPYSTLFKVVDKI